MNMSHLSTDRLAALGDDGPTPAEAAHLASCAECAREREAYRTLVAMAHAERGAIGLPLTRWDSIAGALAAEPARGTTPVIDIASTDIRAGSRRFRRMPLQAAAAVLLVAGGAVAGRVTATIPASSDTARVESPARSAPARNVSSSPDSVFFSSVDEARDAQARSGVIYQQATTFLAQHDSSGASYENPAVVQSRLAALDQISSITREAMRQAPHDPVINGYYLTTLGQREATLRQLSTVMPASLRPNSF